MLFTRSKFARRLLGAFLLLSITSLGVLGLLLSQYFHDAAMAREQENLMNNAHIIELTLAEELEATPIEMQDTIEAIQAQTGLRVTVLCADGQVIADSEGSAGQMDNHLLRPEVQQALHRSYGTSVRYSDTLQENMLYVAIPVHTADGISAIIRTAAPLTYVEASYNHTLHATLLAMFFALLVSILVAVLLARRTLRPLSAMTKTAHAIAAGDLKRRIHIHSGDEFDVLGSTINHLAMNLIDKIEHEQVLNRRQQVFIDNAAHELKTPLTSISGFAETLQEDDFQQPEMTRHFLRIIYDESQRMTRLINDLLSLARVGHLREDPRNLHRVPLDLGDVLQHCADSLRGKANARAQELTVEVARPLPPVSATPDLMEQLFNNLIENAIKYTPEHGHITVSCKSTSTKLIACVRDDGIGIASRDLPFIFDRFYRVDKDRSRQTGGTGLGLSLVKFLAELFDGQITVTSEKGKGTTFRVEFPCQLK